MKIEIQAQQDYRRGKVKADYRNLRFEGSEGVKKRYLEAALHQL